MKKRRYEASEKVYSQLKQMILSGKLKKGKRLSYDWIAQDFNVSKAIVSKVILRHQDLETTQAYLGKVSESGVIRWMDILHGK